MKKILFFSLTIFLSAIAVWYGITHHRGVTCPRCNIIVITVDSIRADHLPCYGYALNTAPHLCAFADENLRFTRMFANSTWTRPSELSMLTSLYPVSHGMTDPLPTHMNPKITTLPQVLYRNGYETTFVSNDHLNMALELGFGRGFQHIQFTPAIINDETMHTWSDTIDSIQTANKKHKPAFVFIHTDHVHDYIEEILRPPQKFPLDPAYRSNINYPKQFTEETWKRSIDYLTHSMEVGWGTDPINEQDAWRTQLRQAKTLDEARQVFLQFPETLQYDLYLNIAQDDLYKNNFADFMELCRHLYDENIRTFDLSFEKLLKRIDEDGISRNTIVVVIGDHGQLLGEYGLIGHILGISNEEIHVPFIARIPGLSSRVIDGLTQGIDLYPTLLDVVGISPPKTVAGISLRKLLTNQKNAPQNKYVISQTLLPDHLESIQTDRWRLVEGFYPIGISRNLYDLARDPKQLHSVSPTTQPVVDALTKLLETTIRRQPVYPPVQSAFPDWFDATVRKQRIDKGYYFDPLHG